MPCGSSSGSLKQFRQGREFFHSGRGGAQAQVRFSPLRVVVCKSTVLAPFWAQAQVRFNPLRVVVCKTLKSTWDLGLPSSVRWRRRKGQNYEIQLIWYPFLRELCKINCISCYMYLGLPFFVFMKYEKGRPRSQVREPSKVVVCKSAATGCLRAAQGTRQK